MKSNGEAELYAVQKECSHSLVLCSRYRDGDHNYYGWIREVYYSTALISSWHVRATRFFRQRVASQRVGTGAGTTAHIFEFAGAALAFQLRAVTQRAEEW